MARLLFSMESSLDFETVGDTLGEKFANLHTLSRKNRVLGEEMTSYARFVTEMVKSRAANHTSSDVKEMVVKTIFSSIVRGMAWRYNDVKPKVHHWLPVTYLKGFSISQKTTRGVRAQVPAIIFSHGQRMRVVVKDAEFAHPVNADSSGYYDLAVEKFFSNIEGVFAIGRDATDTVLGKVHLAAFFVVQSVRNPHPSVGFSSGDITTVLSEVIENLDYLDEFYVDVVETEDALPFTPYIPTRIRRDGNGHSIMCLAITPYVAVILSDGMLNNFSRSRAVSEYKRYIISEAKRNGGVIFGIEVSDVD